MSAHRIPLSATPFNLPALERVMSKYSGFNQMQPVADFEKVISDFTGTKYALALSSGTAAIHLALQAVGVGPGDLVLVSTFTYVATINPIIYLGAEPIFVDSESQTWNLDPGLASEALETNNRIKAILVVHAYGMPANMSEIISIAKKYGVPVIEDAAEGLGSSFNSAMLGAIGSCGIFSFNNNKIITTYGGGVLVTNNEAIYRKALLWASQSRENKPYYEHKEIGYNYRMNPLAAMQGLSAMPALGQKMDRRRKIYQLYKSKLAQVLDIEWVDEPKGSISNRWLSTILMPSQALGGIQKRFAEAEIEVRPLWKPMHEQPVFQRFTFFNRGISSDLFSRGLALPSSDGLSELEVDKIVAVLSSGLGY